MSIEAQIRLDVCSLGQPSPSGHSLSRQPEVGLTRHGTGFSERPRRRTLEATAVGMARVLAGGRSPAFANPDASDVADE